MDVAARPGLLDLPFMDPRRIEACNQPAATDRASFATRIEEEFLWAQ
jgi:hypothetical protein